MVALSDSHSPLAENADDNCKERESGDRSHNRGQSYDCDSVADGSRGPVPSNNRLSQKWTRDSVTIESRLVVGSSFASRAIADKVASVVKRAKHAHERDSYYRIDSVDAEFTHHTHRLVWLRFATSTEACSEIERMWSDLSHAISSG